MRMDEFRLQWVYPKFKLQMFFTFLLPAESLLKSTLLEDNEQSPRRSTIGSSYVRESSSDVLTRYRGKFSEERKRENSARTNEVLYTIFLWQSCNQTI